MPTTPDPLHSDALSLLLAWDAPSADQDALRDEYVDYLHEHPDAVHRRNRSGHLTASALVVDPTRGAVLLTLHPLVGRWLQLGGHIEPSDDGLIAAARREAVEEGGIAEISIDRAPLRLDRHLVTCRDDADGRDTLAHLDVQFLAIVDHGAAEPRMSDESLDLRWWSWEALPADTDDSVRSLVAAARRRLDP